MRKTKRLLSFMLALLMLAAMGLQMVSCKDPTTPPDDEKPGENNPPVEGQQATYTVSIKTAGGMSLDNIMVYVYNTDGYIVAKNSTDENGNVSFTLPASPDYKLELSGVPDGYILKDKYDMGTNGTNIVLVSEIIEDTDLSGVTYKLGMIMRDFEVTTSDGQTFKLSEVLKTKKAVMLNFWYTTCTYCVEEFPDMHNAYLQYQDDIEIIALNNYGGDNANEVADFKQNYYGYELAFPMAKDTAGVEDAFQVPGNPVSVMIDRYGMISLIHVGAVPSEKYFTNMFAHYVSDDYRQGLYGDVAELIPAAKPDKEMPSSEELSGAINKGDITVTYEPEIDAADAEYSWPFEITEKDGSKCIIPSNADLDSSFATLHAKVSLKAGQAFMFDYFSSTDSGYDVLYVLVNGDDIYQISGISSKWNECCPWVATEDGVYDVAFVYYKDVSDSAGDDVVYMKDFRVVDAKDVGVASYIPRQAATNPTEDMSDYQSYVQVFLNETDGYYHVGSVDGPILLAKLIYGTSFSSVSVTENLYQDGSFTVDGVNRFAELEKYCNYAANSKIYTYCSVTEELRTYLEAYVAKYGFDVHENTWLQLCAYYDSYGKNADGTPVAEFEDPIKGLSTHSAYKVVEGKPNKVEYTGVNIMPRGYLYEFIPTKTGVYRITSNSSSQEVDGWIFIGNDKTWIEFGDRILYTSGDEGERFCPDLLIETEVKDEHGNVTTQLVRDNNNSSMVAYMEAGTPYYIDFAYYDIYGAGAFTFDVKYIGETFDYFIVASHGPFEFELGVGDSMGDTVAGGIDVMLGEDGYYYHKKADGTKGSLLYADFYLTTNIFTSQSLKDMTETHAFNFALSEYDHIGLNAWERAGKDEDKLRQMWGENFDAYWELYQMDDIIKGVYHGTGEDMTAVMKSYVDKMLDEEGYPERQGCVVVDKQLADILQTLMDKYTFKGVDHSWTKLCYYYKYLGY
jgi:peroxiredoxin